LDQSEQGTAFEVWGSLSTDGGRRWSSASIVRGFDRVSDMIDLVSDDAGRLYLAGIGQAAGGESTIMLSEWDGQTWHLQDSFGLGQAANPGNAVKLAIAPAAGRLSALLRSQIWDQTGTAQFEVSATNRPIAASSPVIPAPTFTPIPPPGPTPTLALPPTPTPRPQLPASNAKPLTQGGGPPPLVLGGILAAGIVIAVVARTIWVRRQHL
jgi:hypothetical protein